MNNMNTVRIICFFLSTLFLIIGCSKNEYFHEKYQSEMKIIEETDNFVKFREADGNIVLLPKNPQRVIVCLNSILDLWYMAGGISIARVNGSINVPDEAEDLPLLGSISTLNTELMMELEPDFLIISYSDYHKKIRDFFLSEGIPGVSLNYSTYEDFCTILDLFTRLTDNRDIYNKTITSIQIKVQSIIDSVPKLDIPPSVCILFATTNYVKVETQNTITGYFCEKLGADNIYKETIIEGSTRVNLSLEYILEADPDIIFVTTMGDIEKCRARMEMDIINSDIWGDLKAVKNNRFIYLDPSYSIYKPNRFYPAAFKIIAGYIYPDTEFTFKENK